MKPKIKAQIPCIVLTMHLLQHNSNDDELQIKTCRYHHQFTIKSSELLAKLILTGTYWQAVVKTHHNWIHIYFLSGKIPCSNRKKFIMQKKPCHSEFILISMTRKSTTLLLLNTSSSVQHPWHEMIHTDFWFYWPKWQLMGHQTKKQ